MTAHGVKKKNRREETVLTRMRIGYIGLNKTLFLIGKSGTDGCECGKTETVEHVLMECERYTEERMSQSIVNCREQEECGVWVAYWEWQERGY